MPEIIAETLVAIRPDTAGFRRDAERKVRTAVDQVEASKASNVKLNVDAASLRNAGTAVKGLLAFEGLQTGARLLLGLAGAASDVEEAVNATNVRFGEGSDIVLRYADSASRAIGITNVAALDAANNFGALLGNAGLAAQESARLSTALVQLGGDIASLQKKDPGDVFQKLLGGLRGETEPLQGLGIIVNETATKAKAMELGLAGANNELTEGEKVLARYALILEQTTEEQGDFSRTSDSYANATRTLSTELTKAAGAIGSTVTPAMAELAANVVFLIRTFQDFGDAGEDGITKKTKQLAFLASPATIANKLLSTLRERYGDTDDAAKAATDTYDGLAEALDDIAKSAAGTTTAIEDVVAAQISAIDAGFGYESAIDGLADARRSVAEAEREYADALNGTGPYAEKAAQATDRLRSAQERLADAQRSVRELTLDVGEAQEELAGAQIRYGVGSKEARDAARELQSKQEDLAGANRDVADASDDVRKAEEERAKVRDLSAARQAAAENLADAQRDLKDAIYQAAGAEVELGKQTAAAKGEVITAKQEVDLLRGVIERLRDTAIPPDSPVRAGLAGILATLAPAGQAAFESFRAGERAFSSLPAFGPSGGGNWAPVPAAVGAGNVYNINVYSSAPEPDILAGQVRYALEEAEWRSGVRGGD